MSDSPKPITIKNRYTEDALINGILTNNIPTLSRAITIIESTKPAHQDIAKSVVAACLKQQKQSLRIGITGVPGVGKSTFIERFGKLLTGLEKKVAVLTVDPTSSKTKGSILGDKTRMQELVQDPMAFIRPSPAGDSLGGVTKKTRESIILLEAAGYDVIIIETVGVGQSETAVHSMVDFFLVLKLAGAGDELQGIKRGILELADAIAINKADGENEKPAQLAEVAFRRALQLFPPKENGWTPTVMRCSALHNTGLQAIWETIGVFYHSNTENGYLDRNREEQNKTWLKQHIEQTLKTDFYRNKNVQHLLPDLETKVSQGTLSPFTAAQTLLDAFREKNDSR